MFGVGLRGIGLAGATLSKGGGVPDNPNLVPNGTFDTLDGWTFRAFDAGWALQIDPSVATIVDGKLRLTVGAGKVFPQGTIPIADLTIGQTYSFQADYSYDGDSTSARLRISDSETSTASVRYDSGDRFDIGGSIDATFEATQTTHFVYLVAGNETPGGYAEFDNIVCQRVDPFL